VKRKLLKNHDFASNASVMELITCKERNVNKLLEKLAAQSGGKPTTDLRAKLNSKNAAAAAYAGPGAGGAYYSAPFAPYGYVNNNSNDAAAVASMIYQEAARVREAQLMEVQMRVAQVKEEQRREEYIRQEKMREAQLREEKLREAEKIAAQRREAARIRESTRESARNQFGSKTTRVFEEPVRSRRYDAALDRGGDSRSYRDVLPDRFDEPIHRDSSGGYGGLASSYTGSDRRGRGGGAADLEDADFRYRRSNARARSPEPLYERDVDMDVDRSAVAGLFTGRHLLDRMEPTTGIKMDYDRQVALI
jgi:hypothetical protein